MSYGAKWFLCPGELAGTPSWVHDVLVSAISDREAQETEKPKGEPGGGGRRHKESETNRTGNTQ